MKKIFRRGLHRYVYLLIIVTTTAVFAALTTIGVSANVGDTFTVNTIEGVPITYKVTSEGAFPEVEVCRCNVNYNGGIILPESVINPNNNVQYSITGIEEGAFVNCKSLTSIVTPDGVTSIESYAFNSCEKLETVILSDKLETIPDQCFYGCSSLKTVTTPSNLDQDGNPKVSGVYLPNVVEVGNYAFFYCANIEKVTLPVCISVGDWAFSCPTYSKLISSLTSVSLPVCTSIGSYAFEGCTNLTDVTLKEGCSIEEKAFNYVPAEIKYV